MIGMKNTIAQFRLDEAPAAAYPPPLPLVGDGIWYHPRMVMTPGGRRRGGRHAPVPSAAEQRRSADDGLAPRFVGCLSLSRPGGGPPRMCQLRVGPPDPAAARPRGGSGGLQRPVGPGDTRGGGGALRRRAVLGLRVPTLHAAQKLVAAPLAALSLLRGAWGPST